jgi:hypothetical protein
MRLPTTPRLTSIDPALDRQVRATYVGQAHFGGSGPAEQVCGGCRHWAGGEFDQQAFCRQFLKMTQVKPKGARLKVPRNAEACRHYSELENRMPKVSDIFGGTYLKAEQWGPPRAVKIDGYNTETIYGDEAYVLYLASEKRGLRLSPTCARDIASFLGDEMQAWSGGEIELYTKQQTITDRDTKEEKLVTMFRARSPHGGALVAPAPSGAPPRSASRRPDPSDDIPY